MWAVATTSEASRPWAIPGSVLRLAIPVALALLVPIVVAFVVGGFTAGLAVSLGYTVTATAATLVPARYALPMAVPGAMAALVAASLNGTVLPAACFVALTCLLVAPADELHKGLLGGIPTVATSLAGMSADLDPGVVGLWTLIGGVLAVAVLGGLPKAGAVERISARTSWRHAIVMAASVGVVIAVSQQLDFPHGYWVALTLTILLRPYGQEAWAKVRGRVLGTIGGAVFALALALVLPDWAQLVAVGVLLVLVVTYAALDRYRMYVMCLTPIIVLMIGGASTESTVNVALERVLATILGAVVAALLAFALAWSDRDRETGVEPPRSTRQIPA